MSGEKHFYVNGARLAKDDDVLLAKKVGLDKGVSLDDAIEARNQELDGVSPHRQALDDILPTLLKWKKLGGITFSDVNPNTDHRGNPIGEFTVSQNAGIKEGAFYIDSKTGETVRARVSWTVSLDDFDAERREIKQRYQPVASLHKKIKELGKYSVRKRDENNVMKTDASNPYETLSIQAYQLKDDDLAMAGGLATPFVIEGKFGEGRLPTVTTLKPGDIIYIPADKPGDVWVATPQQLIDNFSPEKGCKELFDACSRRSHLSGDGKLLAAMPEHALINRWIKGTHTVGNTRDIAIAAITKNVNERIDSNKSSLTIDVMHAILDETLVDGQHVIVAIKEDDRDNGVSHPIQMDAFSVDVDRESYQQHRAEIGDPEHRMTANGDAVKL